MTTQQDRDALAAVLGGNYPTRRHLDIADAILTSDWLAEHVRAKQAEAWDMGWASAYSGRLGPAEAVTGNPYGADHA